MIRYMNDKPLRVINNPVEITIAPGLPDSGLTIKEAILIATQKRIRELTGRRER